MLAVVLSVLAALLASPGCGSLAPPVGGPIVREFAPIGAYGGHWGVDYEVARGSPVRVASSGTVTFAGSVAGMLTISVDHGGGLKTSYSYLDTIETAVGRWHGSGSVIATSGFHNGAAALHFSTRLDGVYQDPSRWLRCGGPPGTALSLSSAYPLAGATWHPRRDVRPPSFRTPLHGRGCLLAAGARPCHFPARRSSLAEERPTGFASPP